jgi:hypothetical protein
MACLHNVDAVALTGDPAQHQICGLAPLEISQSPPSGQRPPRTKDTRCLQVALARTDVTVERTVSIIRVTRIGDLGMLAVTSN